MHVSDCQGCMGRARRWRGWGDTTTGTPDATVQDATVQASAGYASLLKTFGAIALGMLIITHLGTKS